MISYSNAMFVPTEFVSVGRMILHYKESGTYGCRPVVQNHTLHRDKLGGGGVWDVTSHEGYGCKVWVVFRDANARVLFKGFDPR